MSAIRPTWINEYKLEKYQPLRQFNYQLFILASIVFAFLINGISVAYMVSVDKNLRLSRVFYLIRLSMIVVMVVVKVMFLVLKPMGLNIGFFINIVVTILILILFVFTYLPYKKTQPYPITLEKIQKQKPMMVNMTIITIVFFTILMLFYMYEIFYRKIK